MKDFKINLYLVSSVPNLEYTANEIETVYFTNNNVSANLVEQEPHQNRKTLDTVMNTSFDFLQVCLMFIYLSKYNIEVFKKCEVNKVFKFYMILISGISFRRKSLEC